MKATLRVLTDAPYGTVSPRLYGHFAEHLGRCCYDGLWVGTEQTAIPNIGGFRKDVIEALRAMPTPMLRWPGGCYADHYHWRDGIGPDRPVRLGLSCGLQVLDTNALGTHEFLHFCELIGAEPYLAGNMGSGSVQELCDWVEYCNTPLATTLGKERAANGHAAPYGVKLWGVGNENWGCGGNYEPESYALEYRRYASMMQHVDPSVEMVVCGHDQNWNERCIDKLRHHLQYVNHYSIHRYWINGGPGVDFSEADYYALLKEADDTELFIQDTRALLEEASGGRKHIGIALDEWGVWHPEARSWGPGPVVTHPGDYTQAGTLRDALSIAAGLAVFHRQAASLSLANLAQIVNVLHAPVMTDGEAFWVTPSYYALQMHAIHIGATAMPVEIDSDCLLPDGSSGVTATATNKGVSLMNRHLHQSVTVSLVGEYPTGTLLTSGSPRDENSASAPDRVQPKSLACHVADGVTTLELPPHSLATLVQGAPSA